MADYRSDVYQRVTARVPNSNVPDSSRTVAAPSSNVDQTARDSVAALASTLQNSYVAKPANAGTTGQVLTKQADGSSAWATSVGGNTQATW